MIWATGLLATGSITQNFASEDLGDFVMFGNPYQIAVDINSVFTNSSNNNTNFYYVYDPTLAANGAYVTVTLPVGTSISGEANQFLQPGQGGQVATLAEHHLSYLTRVIRLPEIIRLPIALPQVMIC